MFRPGFERKDTYDFDSQSEDLAPTTGKDETLAADMSTQQITAFADENAGWNESMPGFIDSTRSHVSSQDTNLGNFMERPVRIYSADWQVGLEIFETINPWDLYFSSPTIAQKLDKYELLKANLNIKIIITGTQFHYGRAMVSYSPLHDLDQTLPFSNDSAYLIRESQKPHIFLNPTENEGGEMVLPFFWYKDYLSITGGDISRMGQLNIGSFQELLHANGGDDPVTISIYAWASDVELTMPTANVPLFLSQSMEYGQGIVSKPASTLAKIAGSLASVPQIAPFALATQLGASTVSKIAQLFGYCRTPILSTIQLYKPLPQGNLANTDAPEAVSRLTVDSKQELTIDPRVVGLSSDDELSIIDIAKRESFVNSFQWSTAPLVGDVDALLWNTYVTPTLYDTRSGATENQLHLTPMAHLSQMFNNWQGSITFRFVIVASKFHKGRLLFRFDPNVTSPVVDFAANYSRVVDIAEERDFEITLGWAQALAFLNVAQITGSNVPFSTDKLPLDTSNRYNGVLEVNVLNRLTSPSTDTDVQVLVFARMNDDCVFAKPDGKKINNLSYFPKVTPVTPPLKLESQSQMFDGKPVADTALQPIADNKTDNKSSLVYYGESITSLRSLFKRYVYSRYWVYPVEQTTPQLINVRNKDLPLQPGWDVNGVDSSIVNPADKFTLVNSSPLSHMLPCFAAWRGSMRRKYYVIGPGSASGFSAVTRDTYQQVTPVMTGLPVSNTDSEEATKTLTEFFNGWSFNGTATTLHEQNRCIEVDIPFYSEQRFRSPRLLSAKDLDCDTHFFYDLIGATRGATPVINGAVAEHVATGEDFNLHFFTGVPVQYFYSVNDDS